MRQVSADARAFHAPEQAAQNLIKGPGGEKEHQGHEDVQQIRLDDQVGVIEHQQGDGPEEQPGEVGGEGRLFLGRRAGGAGEGGGGSLRRRRRGRGRTGLRRRLGLLGLALFLGFGFGHAFAGLSILQILQIFVGADPRVRPLRALTWARPYSFPYQRALYGKKGGFAKVKRRGGKTVGAGFKPAPTVFYGVGGWDVGEGRGQWHRRQWHRPQWHRRLACVKKSTGWKACATMWGGHGPPVLEVIAGGQCPPYIFLGRPNGSPLLIGLGDGVWGRGQGLLSLAPFPKIH